MATRAKPKSNINFPEIDNSAVLVMVLMYIRLNKYVPSNAMIGM